MNKIPLTAQRDHIEAQTSASPMKAVAELVWNGLDANSDRVEVILDLNALSGIESIRIRDFGSGIDPAKVSQRFGFLGDSWKKTARRVNDRALHGKHGKGRLKAFALGNLVEWNTTFLQDTGLVSYKITGNASALDAFSFSTPTPTTGRQPGTEVVIANLKESLGSLLRDDAHEELTKLFAAYLSQYSSIEIHYDGRRLDPSLLQEFKKEILLDEVVLSDGGKAAVAVTIIEWKGATKRAIYLCDGSGVGLHQMDAQAIRAPGFQFTVYVKSEHFRELDKDGRLELESLHPDVDAILKVAKQAVKKHFRVRLAERQRTIVERWKTEQVYPYQDKSAMNPVEEAERQVFDIVAVNVEAYLPTFDERDHKSRKFMFMLLAQALRENPESIQRILTEVLNLKPEDQAALAELLTKTELSAIISSARIVANRLDFLVALDNLIFDKETKGKLLERDQLHKILENEAWIFHEDFALSASEQRLNEVLEKHIGKLHPKENGETEVTMPDGKSGRVDLLLKRATQPRTGHHDYLVVELKRPTKKIDDEVITQVTKYAMAVAGDERFNGVPATWTFVAISNEMNEYARNVATQPGKPTGEVYAKGNVRVIVREWAEVINDARARLQFVNNTLSYEANRESAKSYLKRAHEKYIPTGDTEEGPPEESENKE